MSKCMVKQVLLFQQYYQQMEDLIAAIQQVPQVSDKVLTEKIKVISEGEAIDINHKWCDGATPLAVAVMSRNVQAAKLLLQNGADVNMYSTVIDTKHDMSVQVKRGETPLITASRMGYVEFVEPFLAHGANVNLCAQDVSMTPLHWSCNKGHLDVVKVLLDKSEEIVIDKHGDYNFTPLMEAVIEKHCDVVKYLIDRGADMTLSVLPEASQPETPLVLALVLNLTDISKCLIRAGSDLTMEPTGRDALATYMYDGDAELFKLLLLAGTGVKPKDILQLAYVQKKDPEIKQWVTDFAKNPPSLMVRCRTVIRKHLLHCSQMKGICIYIRKLPIPKYLKKYLLLEIL